MAGVAISADLLYLGETMKINCALSFVFFVWLASCTSTQVKLTPTLLSCPRVSPEMEPKLIWSTAGFSNPESVVWDSASKSFYVSNVAGGPTDKDGRGWISKLSVGGKIEKTRWVEELNAPKGMRIRDGVLWVSDIDTLIGVQLSSAKKVHTVNISGSKFLNDIAFLDNPNRVLVSDMADNRIYAVSDWERKQIPSINVFFEGRRLESPNGLLMDGDSLLVAGWGNDIQPDFSTVRPGTVLSLKTGKSDIKSWTSQPIGNLDGIERDGADAVLISDWMAGKVFRLTSKGECLTLLEGIKGAADIGFVPETRMLLVPAMVEDRVAAYGLPEF